MALLRWPQKASSWIHLGALFLKLVNQVEGCGVNDRQYINNPNWNTNHPGDAVTSDGRATYEDYLDLPQTAVVSSCEQACDSYRMTASLDCEGIAVKFMGGTPTSVSGIGYSNSWECDFYATSLPVSPSLTSCTNARLCPQSQFGLYRETVNSCFAASTYAASIWCQHVYGPFTAHTMYTATATVVPAATAVTSTATATVTVTSTETDQDTVYISTSSTVLISDTTTTTTVPVTAVTVSTIVVSSVNKVSTVIKVNTRTTTVTTTVCRVMRALQAGERLVKLYGRPTLASIVPYCLSSPNSNLPTPTSIVSSGCSCLFNSNLATTTTAPVVTSTSLTTITASVSASSTTTSYITSTIFITASSLTTITEVSTTTSSSTRVLTSTSLTTSTNFKTTTTLTTKTVTQEIVKSAIPTYPLFVQPVANTRVKYRIFSRKLGSSSNPDPESRIFQYSHNAAGPPGAGNTEYPGVNVTIINGQLYVMSRENNPKLYGVSMAIEKGMNSGRTVLGQQLENSKSALTGCVINSSTNVLTCKTPNGKSVATWQELGWPSQNPEGRLLLALIPPRGGTGYRPLMQLVVGVKGSAQIGC